MLVLLFIVNRFQNNITYLTLIRFFVLIYKRNCLFHWLDFHSIFFFDKHFHSINVRYACIIKKKNVRDACRIEQGPGIWETVYAETDRMGDEIEAKFFLINQIEAKYDQR